MTRLVALLLLCVFGAIGRALPANGIEAPEWLDPDAAAKVEASWQVGNLLDLGNFHMTRLLFRGKVRDVLTNSPLLLSPSGQNVREIYTKVYYSSDKNNLILFTRDPQSFGAYRLTIPRSEIKVGSRFTFPIVIDGVVQQVEFEIIHTFSQ